MGSMLVEITVEDLKFFFFFLQEGTDDGTAIMIVGNKVDLFEEDSERPVTTQNGKKLAEVLITPVLDNFPEYFGMTVELCLHDGVVQETYLVTCVA